MEVAAASARPVLRVAAICGSLRKASFNRGLLRAAAEVCEDSIPGLRIDELDISDLPIINTDLETGSGSGTVFPPAVEAFRAKVCQADCFLFGAPEYNYSIASMSFATPSLLPALLLVRFRSPARTHLLQGD
uniref:NAD(P)H dehydrogenase (quinone) n=1 Tax=Zea mays TaxID=4577 RepID=C0P2E3_MAIZE|nr:unknown [Zea mays]